MNWKDELRKSELRKMPFDAREASREAKDRSMVRLEKLLEKHFDSKLKVHMEKFPGKDKFSLPMDKKIHNIMVNQAGGLEELEMAMMELYNVRDVFIKPGAIPGHTEGKIAYHFELL